MATAALVKFPQYAPDLADIGSAAPSQNITNVFPRGDGYGPVPDITTFTAALPGPCRGYFFARNSDGSIAVFAGTATDLYQLNNTTFTWTRVSQGGVSYSTLVTSDNWQFAQFNTFVIAVQRNTPPQKFVLGSSAAFVNLGGNPPNAGRIAIVGFFVVLTDLLSANVRVQWSDLDAPETWTAGVGYADYADLPDGGSTHAVAGGDAYGLIFQDESIRSLVYAPGSPVVFQINRISTQETLFSDYSVINVGTMVFYCGAAGFKMIQNAGVPTPIGKERVDRTFFADVDRGNLQLMVGASDPTSTRVYWAYKSTSGAAGRMDKMLVYDYALDRWSLIVLATPIEYLASLAKPGLTLEQLDALAPGVIQITGAANNGSGAIRLTLTQLSNQYYSVTTQNFIEVYGVTGTTEANGSWKINVIDSTHIDLVGSTFVNAYTGGGAVGGSLDALTFSLDDISNASIAQLSTFTNTNALGFLNGPNLEAQLETSQFDGMGKMMFLGGAILITDCGTAYFSVGYRLSAQGTILYTTECQIDFEGFAGVTIEARYCRGKVRLPYGASWSFAIGVEPLDPILAGER